MYLQSAFPVLPFPGRKNYLAAFRQVHQFPAWLPAVNFCGCWPSCAGIAGDGPRSYQPHNECTDCRC